MLADRPAGEAIEGITRTATSTQTADCVRQGLATIAISLHVLRTGGAMDESERETIRRMGLFARLPGAVTERILEGSTVQTVDAGTLLFREGDESSAVYVLIGGLVEISKIEGKRECGIMLFTAGDMVMPAAALFDEPYLVSGRVLSPSRILTLDAATLRQLAGQEPALAMHLAQVMGGQWRMAVRNVIDLKCRSAPQRLAAFLLRLVAASPSQDTAELPIRKQRLASRVGMTAETLSRSLQTLADHGLQVRGNRIVVKDLSKIKAFCGPDPYPERTEAALGVHAL